MKSKLQMLTVATLSLTCSNIAKSNEIASAINNALAKYCIPQSGSNCNPLFLADYDEKANSCKCKDPNAVWFPSLRMCHACKDNEKISENGCVSCGEHVRKCDTITGELQLCDQGYYIIKDTATLSQLVCEDKNVNEPRYVYSNCDINKCEDKTPLKTLIEDSQKSKEEIIKEKEAYIDSIANRRKEGETISEEDYKNMLNGYDSKIENIDAIISEYQTSIYYSAKEVAKRNLEEQESNKIAQTKQREDFVNEGNTKRAQRSELLEQKENYLKEFDEKKSQREELAIKIETYKIKCGVTAKIPDDCKDYKTTLANYDSQIADLDDFIKNYDTTINNFDTQIAKLDEFLDNYDTALANYDFSISKIEKLIEQYKDEYDNTEEEAVCSCGLLAASSEKNANCVASCNVEESFVSVQKRVCKDVKYVADKSKCNPCPGGYFCPDGVEKKVCPTVLHTTSFEHIKSFFDYQWGVAGLNIAEDLAVGFFTLGLSQVICNIGLNRQYGYENISFGGSNTWSNYASWGSNHNLGRCGMAKYAISGHAYGPFAESNGVLRNCRGNYEIRWHWDNCAWRWFGWGSCVGAWVGEDVYARGFTICRNDGYTFWHNGSDTGQACIDLCLDDHTQWRLDCDKKTGAISVSW